MNMTCQYLQWHCPRNVSMQIKCPYPVESETWVGDELSINVDSKPKHAKAIKFLPVASKWNVQFDDGRTAMINSVRVRRGWQQ